MPVPMTRPWRHPKTGIYWLRKRVPDELRPIVGKREEKQSLRTKDVGEAKVRLVQALVALDARWANLRRGSAVLTEVEAHKLALPVYHRWIEQHAANPTEQSFWDTEIWSAGPWGTTLKRVAFIGYRIEQMRRLCFETADDILAKAGVVTNTTGRERLAFAVSASMQRASLTLQKLALGEHLEPASKVAGSVPFAAAPASYVKIDTIFADWALERNPAPKTRHEWERIFGELKTFLGHDNAAQIKSADLNGWKAKLLAAGRRPKTIRDVKLAAVRAILQWAVDNDRLPTNPAARVTIEVKRSPSERKRSYTDSEARLILRQAREESNPVLRWIPWVGAFTGARVAELCQLRKEDVIKIDDVWCLKITGDAGSVKTSNAERIVPIHSALIDERFVDFVERASAGALFKELPINRFGSRATSGTKLVGRWIRKLGITDTRISPNHSWRHRMKTLARVYEFRRDIEDALIGHAPDNVGDEYGEYRVLALQRELEKIPPIIA
jgi:integrase